ncbi:MAG: T9SS type A sorting domain-containing protein [Ignavibacteriaceae bacterium]|nr:T9SS type A sorting domain-containing protein [Ignavibacteriaceae bacterium]
MKYTLLFLIVGIILLVIPINISRPSFNGTDPGCGGGGCHTFEDGKVSVTVTDLQVQITVSGTTNDVAGELVDATGTVVAFNNRTSSNPFTLTAPGPGNYTINAGYAGPLRWDSASVSISVTHIGDNSTNLVSYKLYDNYPNPFNPSTSIKYSLPEANFTTLKIFDALGNEVAVLVDELKSAGTYQVEFNATTLSSGIYYYTIQAGSFNETKKMILMK